MTITCISLNDQVSRSSFSWAQNYNILHLKYFYLQEQHTITLTMMSKTQFHQKSQ